MLEGGGGHKAFETAIIKTETSGSIIHTTSNIAAEKEKLIAAVVKFVAK